MSAQTYINPLPLYVPTLGYGQQVPQVPGSIKGALCYMFALEVADVSKLQTTVDHFLNKPTKGAVTYTVLGSQIMASFLHADQLSSVAQAIGWLPDREWAFWVPLIGTTGRKNESPRLAFWNPYLVLDNSVGTETGREVWGFRKQFGTVSLPMKDTDPQVWEAGGLVYDPLAQSTEGRDETLFRVEQSGSSLGPLTTGWETLKEAWAGLRGLWEAEHDLHSLHLGLELLCEIVRSAMHGQVRMTNLKQFRDAHDSSRACYQAIIESTCTVTEFGGAGTLSGTYQVTVSNYASHNFIDALGLPGASFKATFGGWVKMAFTADAGSEVWKA